MRATEDVMRVWRKFDEFPMETITKAWYSQIQSEQKQRSVELMKLHREQHGTSGNCFDLAFWLIDEFRKQDLECYGVLTPHAHVAVVVLNEEGNRYLCDLGDQWIEPILIDREHESFTEEYLDGFFPGSQVKLNVQADQLVISYRRPNGKESHQTFCLNPVSDQELMAAGEETQRNLRSPLVEKRLFLNDQVGHWEFDDYRSFISYNTGRVEESQLTTIEEWASRISMVSGIHEDVVIAALNVYADQRLSGGLRLKKNSDEVEP